MDAADVPEQMDVSDVPIGAKVKFVHKSTDPRNWGSGFWSKGTVVGIKTKATVEKFLEIDEYGRGRSSYEIPIDDKTNLIRSDAELTILEYPKKANSVQRRELPLLASQVAEKNTQAAEEAAAFEDAISATGGRRRKTTRRRKAARRKSTRKSGRRASR